MVNSWTTKEEALKEFKRLVLIKASLDAELTAFSLGAVIEKPTNEIHNELHCVKIQINDIEKKFNITLKDITI